MIENLKPYPEYKDSRLPWLVEVPAHWGVSPLGGLARLKSIVNQPERQLLSVYLQRGVVRFSDVDEKRTNATSEDLSKYQSVDPGDFVLNNQQAWRGSVGVSDYTGIVSPAYLVLALSKQYLPRYANLLFRDQVMVSQYLVCSKGVGSIQRNLYWPHLKRVGIVIPPPEEQAAIALFLDWATNRLDHAIAAKRRIIALLQEQKEAIIHRAVTRGLDPSVPLKDSGIPWLGEIPDHWEVITIGAISELLQTGPFGSQLHQSDYISGGIPVINPSHLSGGEIRHSSRVTITTEKAVALSRHRLRSNDILIARRGDLGRCAVATASEEGWICGTGSLLLRCKSSVIQPDFLQIVFSSRGMCQMLELSSIGATMANLNEGSVARQCIPLPPLAEQEEIVASIRISSEAENAAIIRLEREITLLREYRTRLIADVVTGKLDVRQAAAELPEEIEPLDAGEPGDEIEELGLDGDEEAELP